MRRLRSALITFLTLTQLAALCGCTGHDTLWIYSSIRHDSEDALRQAFAKRFPTAEIKWYVAGSEKIAQTLEAERAAGIERADLVVTADPFWYFAGKNNELFRAYDSPASRSTPISLNDPGHRFSAIRLMTFAIAYNPRKIAAADAPRAWKDLLSPRWRGKITIPNPLESGTTFAFVALISKLYGTEYLSALKRVAVDVGTTSDSVIARLESGEKQIGVMLVEDVLRAKRSGAKIETIYPGDGAIAIPGFVAILKSSKSRSLAEQAYDFFFSETAQSIFLANGMHSPLKLSSAPSGGRPWDEIHWQNIDWASPFVEEIVSSRERIKKSFSDLFLKK